MPWWSSQSSEEPKSETLSHRPDEAANETSSTTPTTWEHYSDPRNLVAVVVLSGACVGSYALFRSYLRRIPQASLIQQNFWRKRSLFGTVTRVGDGDNFHLFHTPGGRLAGWGWLRKIPEKGKQLKDKTVHVRLAGVDAPELAHFGRPGQPYGEEAIDWLTKYILHQRVRAYVYKKDQYERAVATVFVRKWFLRRDVGLQMLKKGLATVYEAKTGAEFAEGMETVYSNEEQKARKRRKGMWSGRKSEFESPRDFKNRMAGQDDGDHK